MSDNRDHYSIVIGIDQYPLLGYLSTAVRSATTFAEWLGSPDGDGLPPENIQLILSSPESPANPFLARPVASQIDEALVRLGTTKGERVGKRLYFYFAGQAYGTSFADVFMLMANASPERPGSNIGLKPYRDFLCQSTSFAEVVYILDCAFLGQSAAQSVGPSLAHSLAPRRTSVKELILMSSPMSGKAAQVDDSERKAYPGLLTKAVLEGLRGAAASSEGRAENRARITAVSLGDYVRARVRDLATGPKQSLLPEMLLPTEEIVFSTVELSLLSGTLVVQVPHWSAEVRVCNSLRQLVVGPLKLQATPGDSDTYQAETKLPEGIYRVDVSLEGQTESQFVGIQFNQTATIRKEQWKSLKFATAAPLTGSATTHEWHMGPAVEWSKKLTWSDSPGGANRTSRLFLFVRTVNPDRYPRFAEGLRLLNADGEEVTNFSEGVETNGQYGWLAFCADLMPGCYILRRGRPGVRVRQQLVYLCKDWETQVFLQAKATPSLRTLSLNMAPKGDGFQPNDETAIAAAAMLDRIRYGGRTRQLIDKEKLSVLLHGKFVNPWLGILAAYVVRTQLDKQPGDQDDESLDLLAHLMKSLDKIGEHPDVQALKLDFTQPAPEPFTNPPLLLKGLKMVGRHARQFSGTIPEHSLTELVIDNLLENSPWTAWRHLATGPTTAERFAPAVVGSGKQLARMFAGRALTYVASLIQSSSPKVPVLRLADIMKNVGQKLTSSRFSVGDLTSSVVSTLGDASLLEIIQKLMQEGDLDKLPVTITLNGSKGISDLLQGVMAESISQSSGLSLARTESSLQSLRERSSAPEFTVRPEAQQPQLTTTEKVVLEYALAKSATQGISNREGQTGASASARESDALFSVAATDQGTDLPPGRCPTVSIEDCVAVIRGEACRILTPPEGAVSSDLEMMRLADTIADRLLKAANSLLERAAFTATTDQRGHVIYANRAFISLITPPDDSLKEKERASKQRSNNKVWEDALAKAPIGQSMLSHPVSGFSPKEFRLWRTEIKDEASQKPRAYLNTLRGTNAPSVTQSTLKEINELLPDLARYASFFSYDSSEGRKGHAVRLDEITRKLEEIINICIPAQGNQIAADDLDLIKPDTGLYDHEFWAVSRHQLIADVAEGLLKPKTLQKINQVLKPLVDQGFPASLSDLAGWADLTKHRGPEPEDDEDTKVFLADNRNKGRGAWHFVDLPLDAVGYSREKYPTLTNDEDVVQMIKEAVRVLRGKSDRFSPINAMRLVVHLVGDVHQPVHVGCAYLEKSGPVATIVRNPQVIVNMNLPSDVGGNKLILPIGHSDSVNLHSYWDSRLGGSTPDINPQSDGEGDDVETTTHLKARFSDKLRRMIDQDPLPVAGGGEGEGDTSDPEDWAEAWANDSLAAAQSAYKSIEIVGAKGSNFDVDWEGKEAYDQRCKPIALERMKSAARNLATLLDAIFA